MLPLHSAFAYFLCKKGGEWGVSKRFGKKNLPENMIIAEKGYCGCLLLR